MQSRSPRLLPRLYYDVGMAVRRGNENMLWQSQLLPWAADEEAACVRVREAIHGHGGAAGGREGGSRKGGSKNGMLGGSFVKLRLRTGEQTRIGRSIGL